MKPPRERYCRTITQGRDHPLRRPRAPQTSRRLVRHEETAPAPVPPHFRTLNFHHMNSNSLHRPDEAERKAAPGEFFAAVRSAAREADAAVMLAFNHGEFSYDYMRAGDRSARWFLRAADWPLLFPAGGLPRFGQTLAAAIREKEAWCHSRTSRSRPVETTSQKSTPASPANMP